MPPKTRSRGRPSKTTGPMLPRPSGRPPRPPVSSVVTVSQGSTSSSTTPTTQPLASSSVVPDAGAQTVSQLSISEFLALVRDEVHRARVSEPALTVADTTITGNSVSTRVPGMT